TQPNLWEDRGINGCADCAGDGLFATEDSNGNGTLDRNGCQPGAIGPCEGGTLYFFPAGPDPTSPTGIWHDPSEAVKVESCSVCAANDTDPNPNRSSACGPVGSRCDTEDLNGNGMMDRFKLYGVDVCSLPNASTNPACT